MERRLLSLRQAARQLDVSEQLLRRAVTRGTIQAASGPDVPTDPLLGKLWFTEEEVERYDRVREGLSRRGRVPKQQTTNERPGRSDLVFAPH
jgi:hypothetical protein